MSKGNLTPKDKRVLECIERHPGIQNSDAKLLDTYWHEVDGWDDSKSLYWNLLKVTPPGSITRSRRKLHEKEYIVYEEEVEKAREKKYIQYRDENGEMIVRFA